MASPTPHTNPPIRGHHLIAEGLNYWRTINQFVGGCQCGARPPQIDTPAETVSKGAMRRWHREHKAAIRVQAAHAVAHARRAEQVTL